MSGQYLPHLEEFANRDTSPIRDWPPIEERCLLRQGRPSPANAPSDWRRNLRQRNLLRRLQHLHIEHRVATMTMFLVSRPDSSAIAKSIPGFGLEKLVSAVWTHSNKCSIPVALKTRFILLGSFRSRWPDVFRLCTCSPAAA